MSETNVIYWTDCRVKLSALKPWEDNPRMSTKAQARRILASFEKFGQVQPVAIGPEDEVYDGHQRLSALFTIHGGDYAIDARRASRALSDTERRELVLALHNATGGWNWDTLSGWNSEALSGWGFDNETLKQWNNDANNLKELLKSETPTEDAEPQIDRAEELRAKWGVELGQMWQLGDHRIICGDCTVREVVERVMGGEMASACITDPPWNVKWDYDEYDDNLTPDEYKEFSDNWRTQAEAIGCKLFMVALSMKTYKYFSLWFPMAERIFAECQNFVQHTGGFMQFAYNPILIWGEPNNKKSASGQRDYFIAETSNTKSSADKELAKINSATRWPPTVNYLVSFSDDNTIVYEPFSGSGTTIIACQNLGRKCRAVEISPAYVAVAIERFSQAFPGVEIRKIE